MAKPRYTATIVRDANGRVFVRLGTNGPDGGGNVTIIDTLHQRENESPRALRSRAHLYIREHGLS